MGIEPRQSHSYGDKTNPYQGRWRWWYPGIADWMIRNPDGTLQDCATYLKRSYSTISLITRTDMFQEYLAQRRAQWQQEHDFSIVSKLTKVAEKSLDLLFEKMEKQADKIPMKLVTETATSALDRLGYAPKTGAAVNVNVNTGVQQVMMPISEAALLEAREAIRAAERKQSLEQRQTVELNPPGSIDVSAPFSPDAESPTTDLSDLIIDG